MYFLKKKLLVLMKHFETVMLMWPKKFLILSFYSTFSEYSYNKARKTHARCKVVGIDTGGLGAKHRKCFFFFLW